MKTRVVILVPTLKKGGAEKQASLLASVLKDNYDVWMLIPFPNGGMEEENIAISSLSNERIIRFEGKYSGSKIKLYKELRRLRPDVLFCYLTWTDFWGPICGRLAGVKYIFQGLRNAQLPKVKLLFEKFGNIISTGAIVNNYAGVEVFEKAGIKRQTVIPNCYPNPQKFMVREIDCRRTVNIITVGRFVAQKDYPTLITAVKEAMIKDENIRLTIIGHGELEYEVRTLVEQNEISDRTSILINPKRIMNYLSKADIYLSTSLFEGTSNSIMEALDASLPVICTNVGDNSKLVRDGYNGYLIGQKEISAIADKINELAASPEMRVEMGRRGNELLKQEFSVAKFLARYEDLIASLKLKRGR